METSLEGSFSFVSSSISHLHLYLLPNNVQGAGAAAGEHVLSVQWSRWNVAAGFGAPALPQTLESSAKAWKAESIGIFV